MLVNKLLGLTLKGSELEMMSDIVAQLVFGKQVLPPDVLTRVTIGKYVTGPVHNNTYTNIAWSTINR